MRGFAVIWILTIAVVWAATASPSIGSNDNTVHTATRNQLEEGFIRKLNTKCSQRDNHSCMMLKLIVYMNRIFKKSSIDVTDKIKVTENKGGEVTEDYDDDMMLARAAKTDDETLGVVLAEKVWKFIRSRTLRYKLMDNADFVLTTEPKGNLNFGLSVNPVEALEEARGKNKNAGTLLALFAAKAGLIGAIFLKGVILLTGKAFIVSKLALILTLIIALKKLLHKKAITYEVHPHHHESHDVHSGWSRALDGFLEGFAEMPVKLLEAQDLAYGGQKPEEETF